METFIINVPEKKAGLVKQLLKELGVTIKQHGKALDLAEEINRSVLPGEKPTMDEIVEESHIARIKLQK